MEKITTARVATLIPKLREECANIIDAIEQKYGIVVRVTRAFATMKEQDDLYKKFIQGGPKAAPAGLSYHNYGMAIDFCILHKDKSVSFNMNEDCNADQIADWKQIVAEFTSNGWVWGHSFGDNDHLEKSFGYTVQQLKAMKKDDTGYPII